MMHRLAHKRHGGWTRRGFVWTGLALALLWITGIVLYAWPSGDTAALESWQANLRHWAIVIHGSVVWIVCVLAGRWVWPHVGTIWARKRTSAWFVGIATMALLVLIAATGLALLYGPAGAHDAIASGHWWSAVAIPLAVGWHAKGLFRRRHK